MYKYMMPVLVLLFFALNPIAATAQTTISTNGNVAIGDISPSNSHQLTVECSGCSQTNKTGVHSLVLGGSGYSRGLHGVVQNAYNSVGVYGQAGNGFSNYGVWGAASGGYGGYFTGGLYVSGGITEPSDERLKINIRELERRSLSAGIGQLRPLRYEFLSAEELRQRGFPSSHYVEGEHWGLSAQDVEAIFPELVKDVIHPLDGDDPEAASGTSVTKGVNYKGLVVALIATAQELQARVEALEAELQERR